MDQARWEKTRRDAGRSRGSRRSKMMELSNHWDREGADCAMLAGSIFLLVVEPKSWSFDARLSRSKKLRGMIGCERQ